MVTSPASGLGGHPRRYPGSRITAPLLPSSPERPWRSPPFGGGGSLPGHSCGTAPDSHRRSLRGARTVADGSRDPSGRADRRAVGGGPGADRRAVGSVPGVGPSANVLILGGTAEARELAGRLDADGW